MPEMKAIIINEYGGPDVLTLADLPRPEPAPGEILVRTHAAGINPVDWKIRRGYLKDQMPAQFPLILGYDVAGTVAALGEGVTQFAAGDEVFAHVKGGGYAEYVASPATSAARKSGALDFAHAAALPVAALTAWQALFTHADLQPGQRVLVHAGAGGVGHLAVQFAKTRGAFVFATASATNQDFLRELGADVPINYSQSAFDTFARDLDVVFDTIGGDTEARSWPLLKPGGVLVSIVDFGAADTGAAHGRRGVSFSAQDSGPQLSEAAALIDAGKVKVDVSAVLPLAEVRRAHELSETGHTRGKIVLLTA